MQDRELLELAAKAAGWKSWDWLAAPRLNVYDAEGRHDVFDPLTDDGDAFRLAVKLNIELGLDPETIQAFVNGFLPVDEPRQPDQMAATRRAIVRTAAEIGKEKPSA